MMPTLRSFDDVDGKERGQKKTDDLRAMTTLGPRTLTHTIPHCVHAQADQHHPLTLDKPYERGIEPKMHKQTALMRRLICASEAKIPARTVFFFFATSDTIQKKNQT